MSLHSLARDGISSVLSISPVDDNNKLKMALEPYEVVSFDIFDTLLKRNVVTRADVYRLSQTIYENEYGPLGFELALKRLHAEANLYKKFNSEIVLEDIYAFMGVSPAIASRLETAELSAERLLSVPFLPMKEIYDWALSNGKRVVITSDMYLPSAFIAELLENAGYSGYERLFISSDYGCRKLDGDLFNIVLATLGVPSSHVVHLGDSVKPDYVAAKNAGLDAVLIPKRLGSTALDDMHGGLSLSIARGVANNLAAGHDYFYRFGAEALGPLLFGLSRFVHGTAVKHDAQKIFFLARDGYVLKRAYELIYPEDLDKTRYLYASRKSYGIPSIYCLDDLIDAGPTTRLIEPSSFLRAVGVPADKAEEISLASGYSGSDRITKLECLDDVRFNKMCSLALPYSLNAASDSRAALVGYLKQEGVDESSAVFDLGWAGNIQGFLNRVLKNELGLTSGVRGIYLGMDESKYRHDIEFSAFLGFDYPNLFLELVELCFSAPEGTTKRFELGEDERFQPVLAAYEYEGLPESDAVRAIQRGALDFVSRFSKISETVEINLSASEAFSSMRRVGTEPSHEDLIAFSGFRFEDGGSYVGLADPKTLRHYLLHPHDLKADLASSRWKVGFVKKLFGIPLPYYKLLLAVKQRRAAKNRKISCG